MLSFIPDSFLLYIINTILIVGAVGSFLSFFVINRILRWFPALSPYYLILQVVSAALLVAGLFFKGGYSVEMEWREKVRALEEQIKIAEERANTKNVEIQTKIVEKTKVIKEKAKTQIEYVDRVITQDKEVVKYIENCPIPKIIVDEHNKAATPPEVIKQLNDAAENKK